LDSLRVKVNQQYMLGWLRFWKSLKFYALRADQESTTYENICEKFSDFFDKF